MNLYNYFRSSALFRVRIALELKSLNDEYVAVHTVRDDHRWEPHAALRADTLVPLLSVDGQMLSQSMAIIEYLGELHPVLRLLPADVPGRAQVRALAQSIACKINPLNNLRVLQCLTRDLKVDKEAKSNWCRDWCCTGLEAFECQLAQHAAAISCHSSAPILTDCCLVPQLFNAARFNVSVAGLPRIRAARDARMALPAFQRAKPSACADSQP